MVQSDIFDAIKNIDEVRKIDDLYLVVDGESNSEDPVESIIFEINKSFGLLQLIIILMKLN